MSGKTQLAISLLLEERLFEKYQFNTLYLILRNDHSSFKALDKLKERGINIVYLTYTQVLNKSPDEIFVTPGIALYDDGRCFLMKLKFKT